MFGFHSNFLLNVFLQKVKAEEILNISTETEIGQIKTCNKKLAKSLPQEDGHVEVDV